MKTIVFKKECKFKGKYYAIGDVLKNVSSKDIDDIRSLNEKGFIEPLNLKELSQIADGSFFIKEKKMREEEE